MCVCVSITQSKCCFILRSLIGSLISNIVKNKDC